MKQLSVVTFILVLCANTVMGSKLPTPTPVQYTWHEQERIMFVAIDPCTWQGREYDDHSPVLHKMKMPELNTDQWAEAAVSWGAKEILFVAKHTGGFCWWQTDTADYSVKSTPWDGGKGDLLVELAKSSRKYGLNMGIYVYPGDDTWGAGIGSGGKTKDPSKQEAYNKVFRQQLREAIELASEYVKVTEVWFDGSTSIDVNDILVKYAPDAAIFQGPMASIRWVGNEKGRLDANQAWSTTSIEDMKSGLATSEHSDPMGDAWIPLEVDTTLYDHAWFWSKRNERKRKSLDELIYVYYQSVGQGAVMLLNSSPNTQGLIPDGDMKLYKALGDEIDRRFSVPLAITSGEGEELVLDFDAPTQVNHIDIMEDYRHGERVRKYTLEGYTQDNEWEAIVHGEHVGRKTIRWFDDITVTKLRLRISEYVEKPLIKQFAAYRVSNFRVLPDEPKRSRQTQCATFEVNGEASIDIDLSPYITEVGQWQIQFQTEQKVKISNAILYQAGQASTRGILKRDRRNKKAFNINRTAVITERTNVRFVADISGKNASGVITIQQR